MRTYITALILAATLALVSCGGGNDVASTGASAVSAATSTASTPAIPTTEAKVNGQIDERTGVAPVAAMTLWSPTANGGCGNSSSFKGSGPALTPTQQSACTNAILGLSCTGACNNPGGSYLLADQCIFMGGAVNYASVNAMCAVSGSSPYCVIKSQLVYSNGYTWINGC